MAIETAAWVTCDVPGCRERSPETEFEHGTIKRDVVRVEAAALDGWTYRWGPSSCGYDLCSIHRDEVPGRTFPDWRKPAGWTPHRRQKGTVNARRAG